MPSYFRWYGRTFRYTSGEIVETVHSKLKKMEQKHQLHVKTSLGTIYHKQRLRKSICLWNFKVLGQIPEMEANPNGPEVIGAAEAESEYPHQNHRHCSAPTRDGSQPRTTVYVGKPPPDWGQPVNP